MPPLRRPVRDRRQAFLRRRQPRTARHRLRARFSWDVWVSWSAQNFGRVFDLWKQPGRESEPPYFGWLNSNFPGHPETLSLKTMVHTRPVGVRPLIGLEATDHHLAVEQRTGIT